MSDLTGEYKILVSNPAWRDLDELLTKIHNESNTDLDSIHLTNLNVSFAAHARGLREAVRRIRSHVDYQLGGGPK